jgi:hypothetical protein
VFLDSATISRLASRAVTKSFGANEEHDVNITRDSLHPILKEMGRESAGFHPFRRFRKSILQRSEARTLLIDYWMGHANGEMSGRYGKQLLKNVMWRQECATKVGLGFTLSITKEQPHIVGQVVGQVLSTAEHEAIAL